jgi:hypothetical protein
MYASPSPRRKELEKKGKNPEKTTNKKSTIFPPSLDKMKIKIKNTEKKYEK